MLAVREHELGLGETVRAARPPLGELERLPDLARRLALEAGAVREQPAKRQRRRAPPPGTCRSSGSSSSSLPSSPSSMTAAAVNVFVIEPIRYWVSGSRLAAVFLGDVRPRRPRRPRRPGRRPPRRSAAGSCACPSRRMRVSVSGGGEDTERPGDQLDRAVDVLVGHAEMGRRRGARRAAARRRGRRARRCAPAPRRTSTPIEPTSIPTKFVSVASTSTGRPAAASPTASRFARAWSSASRSTLWSSA